MYGLVWNRVVFLAAGIAFGWNLVNYWTAPLEQREQLRLRLAASAVAALGLALWLGSQSVAAGVSGLLVAGASALTAYAANARQKNRPPEEDVLDVPQRPETQRDEALVLLIAAGEPPTYTGPEPWAAWLAQPEIARRLQPSWFSRPLLYHRVRAVYGRMGNSPLVAALQALADAVGARLASDYKVVPWLLTTPAELARPLRRWAEEGYRRVLFVPLNPAPQDAQALQEVVVRSRVREIGVRVDMVASGTEAWPAPDPYERILQMMSGQPVAAPSALSSGQLDALVGAIQSAA